MDRPLAPEPSDAVPDLDPVASARWLAQRRSEGPWLHDEVGQRMARRLAWFVQRPRSWLDCNPALGGQAVADAVRAELPHAQRFLPSALEQKALNAPQNEAIKRRRWWPFGGRMASGDAVLAPGEQVDMVWANMLLHAVPRPREHMQQWLRWLRVGGFVMFSGLGPDSLRELRALYRSRGWAPPAHGLTDMHDWGDMLVASGFADPVMDMERMVLTYASAQSLVADLRSFGRNLSRERDAHVRGRAWRGALLRAMEEGLARDAQGRLQLTLEVIFGHAVKGAPRVGVAPEARLTVADMRQMLAAGRLRG